MRLATAGSVDDGKSTLIGRLLLRRQGDPRGPARARRRRPAPPRRHARPRAAHRRPARRARAGHHDRRRLPLLRDAAAQFIIADTPGHVQYTRNMVTGASTADLAIVLVDARNGVVEQTRRHAFIAALLRHPAPGRGRQQDGPRRLRRGGLRRDRRRASRRSPTNLDVARHHVHPDLRAARATTSSSAPRRWPGTAGRRCSSTSRPCSRRRPQPRRRCASRCST